jgi:hypothetical protein
LGVALDYSLHGKKKIGGFNMEVRESVVKKMDDGACLSAKADLGGYAEPVAK